jgi:hypothetical protein
LFGGVVAIGYGGVVVWTGLQNGEFGIEVAGEEGEERDYGQDYRGDERVCAGGEGGGETGMCVSIVDVRFLLLRSHTSIQQLPRAHCRVGRSC